MHTASYQSALVLVAVAVIGCGDRAATGPFGAPSPSPLLSPIEGAWVFDFDKTLAAQQSAGATDENLAQLRKFHTDHPEFGNMHSDLTFDGNVAVGTGPLQSEYRFFGMHKHDSKICGKAWHHEDRHDPGDMSKCFVRLEIIDGNLHLEVNMDDGLPDLNDPDLLSTPAAEGEVAQCDLETKASQNPDDWVTYVFSRP